MLKNKVTLEDIERVIVDEVYSTPPGGTLTICTLTVENGAKIVGTNYGAIDPNEQNWDFGKKAARDNAIEKLWELENYLLRQRHFEQKTKIAPSL